MPRVTTSLDDEHMEYVEELKAEENLSSDSAAVRAAIERGMHADELERELEHARARNRELENKLMSANQRIDAANELVRHVEGERTLAERKAHASLTDRARWWLFGMPDEDD